MAKKVEQDESQSNARARCGLLFNESRYMRVPECFYTFLDYKRDDALVLAYILHLCYFYNQIWVFVKASTLQEKFGIGEQTQKRIVRRLRTKKLVKIEMHGFLSNRKRYISVNFKLLEKLMRETECEIVPPFRDGREPNNGHG